LQVYVAPTEAANLVFPEAVAGHEQYHHAVAQFWLRFDDRLDSFWRVCASSVRRDSALSR
jgi:hypothetical protein